MRKILCTALAGLVLLVANPAFAEPSPDDRAVARSLFDQGRALMKDGKYTEAMPKLEESNRIDPGVGTLFNLADCYEHVGRVASAWAVFGEAADLARRAGQADRETVARERQNGLSSKLPKLRVHLAPPLPPGVELHYDDKPLSTAVLDNETPADPGEHRLRATAPGKIPVEAYVRIEPGSGVAIVDLPALVDAQIVAPVGPARPVEEPVTPPRVEGSTWQKPAAIAAGAGALVALGVGTIFGLRASSQWSDAQKSCAAKRCDDAGYQSWQDSRSSATIGTIGFIAGGVLAAAAVLIFVTAPSQSASASPPTSGTPVAWRKP